MASEKASWHTVTLLLLFVFIFIFSGYTNDFFLPEFTGWRYSLNGEDGWYAPGFDDSKWHESQFPMSFNPSWRDIYVRGFIKNVVGGGFLFQADDCIESVYVNGEKIFEEQNCEVCTHCNGFDHDLTPYLSRGKNSVAIHLVNIKGQGYLKLRAAGLIAPLIAALAASAAAALTFSLLNQSFMRPGTWFSRHGVLPILLLLLVFFSVYMKYPILSNPMNGDFRTIHGYSEDVAMLRNPYRVMDHASLDMVALYPCYLPLVYVFGGALKWVGGWEIMDWGFNYRLISLSCDIGIALLIFLFGWERKHPILGFFGAAFWSFNRFSLEVLRIGHPDVITLLPLVMSLYLFEKKPRTSCVLLGVAVSLKQFPLVVVPVYLVVLGRRLGLMKTAVFIALVPLAVSLPFLASDATGLAKAIWWSFVRPSSRASLSWSSSPLLDFFGDSGLLSRAPILLLYLLLYYLVYAGEVGLMPAVFAALIVFLAYNPYIYSRYFSWVMPLIPLMIIDFIGSKNGSHHRSARLQ